LFSPGTGAWFRRRPPRTTNVLIPRGLKKIIVTGDDFGLAPQVNAAIIEAHRSGILTAASLMVGEKYWQEAAEAAKEHPSLKVGLHLTLVEGTPVLDPRRIPDLVDGSGKFPADLVRAGFRFFFRSGIRSQLEDEIRAQFERFCGTGLKLDHVDAHNHMHLHPTVLRIIVKAGKEYGVKGVRLPNEPPFISWKASGKSLGPRLCSWMFLYPWITVMKLMLRRAGIRHNDYLFGMNDSGAMTEELALRLVANLPDGITEFCFHPATGRCEEIDSTMPRYRHQDEYSALVSESLRRALQVQRAERIAFSDI